MITRQVLKFSRKFKNMTGRVPLRFINMLQPFKFSQEQQTKQSEVKGNGFYMQQIFTGCLAEYAYYIESNGQAVLIDPLRDVDTYLNLARERKADIKYILLTHYHADFVAGHHNLKRETNAKIIMGPQSHSSFIDRVMKDSEEIILGDVKIKVLHTPGHTLESTCYLLTDKDGKFISIFTGDTLFLGEVGRPDLAVNSDVSMSDLAALLYQSLRTKIMTLPNDVQIYPTHGAGSQCGKNIQKGFTCTLGKQKQNNYALQPMSQQQFIDLVTSNVPKAPGYFHHTVEMNKSDDIQDVSEALKRIKVPLNVQQLKEHLMKGVQIIDSRKSISEGFILGSINVPLRTNFASWVGQLLPPGGPLVVIADPGMEEQTMVRLLRVGYDNIVGYLDGGFKSWQDAQQQSIKPNDLTAKDFMNVCSKDASQILLDVRTPSEWNNGVLDGAKLIPLNQLEQCLDQLDKNKQINVYCGTGVRSNIAQTVLRKHGYDKVNTCQVGYQDIVNDTQAKHHQPS